MKRTPLIFLIGLITIILGNTEMKAQSKEPIVRMAKIIVESKHLDTYKKLLKEEIETSIRIEPGVLTLYAVPENNNPTHIVFFETYADTEAYQAHLKRPHFLKYKVAVKDMVTQLDLVEVSKIALGGKPIN